MAGLFSAFECGPLRLGNRIVVSPMCQYSAEDGSANDWHLQHLMTLAMSGAALVSVEATAVERRGRISHGDLGLYSDDNERALARVVAAARSVAPAGTKFAIQLGHAGRKASARRPWEGGGALAPDEDPWPTVAPSAVPSGEGWHMPDALDDAGIERVRNAFVAAAQRAARIGFDVIDLHLAHGYLPHQFQSPLSNRRDDRWGGDAERRRAFPLAIARSVRTAIADSVLLSARISGSDWADGGLTPDDAVIMARHLKAAGVGMVCVSSGGLAPNARIRAGHNYQVPFAERVRHEAGIATQAVGLITTAEQADAIVAEGRADMVAMARAFLDDPRWVWQAARELGAEIALPPQYRRAAPPSWPGRGG